MIFLGSDYFDPEDIPHNLTRRETWELYLVFLGSFAMLMVIVFGIFKFEEGVYAAGILMFVSLLISMIIHERTE